MVVNVLAGARHLPLGRVLRLYITLFYTYICMRSPRYAFRFSAKVLISPLHDIHRRYRRASRRADWVTDTHAFSFARRRRRTALVRFGLIDSTAVVYNACKRVRALYPITRIGKSPFFFVHKYISDDKNPLALSRADALAFPTLVCETQCTQNDSQKLHTILYRERSTVACDVCT
ncbi:unnamed protein product [Aphis gossypii]|uniref:Uncharacterized protein n=1 Tax=Aphis gossypii TaxID=80765 RepID=A0A9P0IXC7_APHGO|nr:unnamed protein product [Aphis gossypii]